MYYLKICFISVLYFYYFCVLISGKIFEGELDTKETWVLIANFCFLPQDGVLQYDISYPKEYAPQNILLYYDDQWSGIYKNQSKSCEDKHKVLDNQNNQIIRLTEYIPGIKSTLMSGCNETIDKDNIRCTHYRKFATPERWWFVVLDNCGSDKGLKLRYNITMTNTLHNQRHGSNQSVCLAEE